MVFEVCMSPDDHLEARAPLPQRLKVCNMSYQNGSSCMYVIPINLHAQKLESAPVVTAEMLEMKQLKASEKKKEVICIHNTGYFQLSISPQFFLYTSHPLGVRKAVCSITHVPKRQTAERDHGSERVTEQRRRNNNDRELWLLKTTGGARSH